jgi:hypothetical protein
MPHLILYFICLLSTALTLAPAAAHVMELPTKINLPKAEYLVAQQLYRGWALVGVVVMAAFVSTLVLSISQRAEPRSFVAALVACLSIVGTQAVFWLVTFPVNRATSNWAIAPESWVQLRKRWEYSHASSAALNFVAFVAVVLAVLSASNA